MLKVSIITVCYNCNNTIENTLKSVFKQKYENIEYIVIDGLSNDGTIEIINKYKSKIDKIVSEKDTGIYNAINKGIKLASGDIISLLHSDDVYTSDKIINEVVFQFNKKPTFHDIEREAAKAASNRMEQLMSKPAPPPKTPSSSAPPPPPPSNITARGASSRDTAGWNKIDNKNIGVRITTSGKVMIARKGATNMEEAQVQHVYNVPSGFVDKLKKKENSFEWYGATWKLNKDTKLYEKQ